MPWFFNHGGFTSEASEATALEFIHKIFAWILITKTTLVIFTKLLSNPP